MNNLWYIIIQIVCSVVTLLTIFLFILRIKYKYSFREIEEIVIYDRSQKSKLDLDSPAIL